jgi:hypothetical protein
LRGCSAGARTQDEAAEDPLTAAQLGVSPNYELYFTNKLQVNFMMIHLRFQYAA